jgi:hypothetical protein
VSAAKTLGVGTKAIPALSEAYQAFETAQFGVGLLPGAQVQVGGRLVWAVDVLLGTIPDGPVPFASDPKPTKAKQR